MADKRYYYRKQPSNEFTNGVIPLLKTKERGHQLICIYEALMLYTIDKGGDLSINGKALSYEEMAAIISEPEEVTKACVEFLKKYGELEDNGGGLRFVNFADQVGSKSAAADRMKKSREKKADTQERNKVTQDYNEVTPKCNKVTQECNEVTQYIEDKENKRIDKSRVVVNDNNHPTLEEVKSYFQEQGFNSIPENFYSYNEMQAWEKVKNWQAAAQRWEQMENKNKSGGVTTKNNYEQRTYDDEFLEGLYKDPDEGERIDEQ